MTHPKHLRIEDFTYPLPDDKIARYPLSERDQSKLLVIKDDTLTESTYRNIAGQLPEQSLLVFNNTRVVEARLLFTKESGGSIEIFCLEPANDYADITTAMLQKRRVLWKCLVGGASKWKNGLVLRKVAGEDKSIAMEARMVEKLTDSFVIEFSWLPSELTFAEILHEAGLVPLPPYLNRTVEKEDEERYQTIYARHHGSVAAPTAGLHFTNAVFDALKEKKIATDYVTLHVGAGTFKPVKCEMIAGHEMHAEAFEVSLETVRNLMHSIDKNIVAVGTTSLRTIESLYWLGVKILLDPGITSAGLTVSQWDPYDMEIPDEIEAATALQALTKWLQQNGIDKLITKTSIIIAPGYKLKVARALITNFHQPQSTLLLLIAAIVGDKWKEIYQYALAHEFRFLSYGDGCLLHPTS